MNNVYSNIGKMKLTPFVKQCAVTAAVASNIVCNVGMIFGFPGVLLPALDQQGSEIHLTKSAASWIASIISIGMLIGNFMTPCIMERYGRKIAHLSVSIPALISWFVIAMAVNIEMLIVARFFQGLSLGLMLPLRSVLLGEYCSPKYRGGFLTIVSLAQGIGMFVVHLLGSLLSWQRTSVVCGALALMSLVIAFYLPESPSWLAVKGRYDDCRKAFRWLRGDEEEKELEEMINLRMKKNEEIDRMTGDEKRNRLNVIGCVMKKKEFYKPIFIIFHCFLMLQMSGNVTMAAFSVQIIRIMMGNSTNAHAWMVALDSLRIITNIAAVFIIHRFKRRTVIFSSGILCALTHVAMAVYVYFKRIVGLSYDAEWIPGCLVVVQFCCIGFGMVPMPTVIAGEVIPLEFRSTLSSLGVVFISVLMFMVLKTFPLLLDSLGLHGTYAIYSVILFYIFTVLWFILPETSGKTLQQIENELKGVDNRREDAEAKVSLKKSSHDNENGC